MNQSLAFPTQSQPFFQPSNLHNAGGDFNFGANGVNNFPQQLAGQQLSFSNVPFSQSVAAPTATAPGGQIGSPFNGSLPQNFGIGRGSPQGQGSAQQSPMAMQPNYMASPQTPARRQSQSYSPRSPASEAREKERLELLLDINLELLEEMQKLQAQGKGGASPSHAQLLRDQGQSAQMAREEFLQLTQRLYANLGYLCAVSDFSLKPGSKPPHPPNYLREPSIMPQLSESYGRLRMLFPGWNGLDAPKVPQTFTDP